MHTNLPKQRWSPSFLLKTYIERNCKMKIKRQSEMKIFVPAWKFLETILVFNTLRLLIARKEFIFLADKYKQALTREGRIEPTQRAAATRNDMNRDTGN